MRSFQAAQGEGDHEGAGHIEVRQVVDSQQHWSGFGHRLQRRQERSADRTFVECVARRHAATTPLAAPAAARRGRQAWTVGGTERSRSASPTHGSRASAAVARLMSTCSPAERRSATIDSQIAVLPMPASPVRITAAELAPSTSSAARTDKRSVARPMRSAGSPATPLLRLQQSDLPGAWQMPFDAAPAYADKTQPGPDRGDCTDSLHWPRTLPRTTAPNRQWTWAA